ncbi:hypothetical protein [Flavihumibacter fluvii]|uniref:hypothetical protein n=1 Tax=Flavihumibacter fluvii TaxID=2838157 RepID=UPI001BDDD450|nr:hypothetical protein [Flavihumibacter fluvii]ULQ50967.1 hypothetical protein KJS93_12815 [Flavihumibacter fluvii]
MSNTLAPQTLLALRKLKVDCLYKKGTHSNAARRVLIDSDRFRVALVAGTIFASFSTIMNVGLWDKIPGNHVFIEVAINILGALGGFLILYTTTFSDYKSKIELANKHESISVELNMIFKKIRNTEACFLDSISTEKDLIKELEILTQEYISRCQNAPLTKDEDFQKARANFKNGYSADYSDKELTC